MQDVKKLFKEKKLDEDGFQLLYEHIEEKRQEKLRAVLEVSYNREEIQTMYLNVGEGNRHGGRKEWSY